MITTIKVADYTSLYSDGNVPTVRDLHAPILKTCGDIVRSSWYKLLSISERVTKLKHIALPSLNTVKTTMKATSKVMYIFLPSRAEQRNEVISE
jgi:hypothetical protein